MWSLGPSTWSRQSRIASSLKPALHTSTIAWPANDRAGPISLRVQAVPWQKPPPPERASALGLHDCGGAAERGVLAGLCVLRGCRDAANRLRIWRDELRQ